MKAKKKATAKKAPRKPAEPETVLILRTTDANGRSYGGFQWPDSGEVACTDWDSAPRCGNGLHGWLWGAGDWSLKTAGDGIKWKVVEVLASDVVLIDNGAKVKFQRGNVIGTFANWADAMVVIRARALKAATNKSVATEPREIASATGHSGHASATGKLRPRIGDRLLRLGDCRSWRRSSRRQERGSDDPLVGCQVGTLPGRGRLRRRGDQGKRLVQGQ